MKMSAICWLKMEQIIQSQPILDIHYYILRLQKVSTQQKWKVPRKNVKFLHLHCSFDFMCLENEKLIDAVIACECVDVNAKAMADMTPLMYAAKQNGKLRHFWSVN